jgi:GTP cyclohydrolase I
MVLNLIDAYQYHTSLKKNCERVFNKGKYFQIKCMGGKERKTRFYFLIDGRKVIVVQRLEYKSVCNEHHYQMFLQKVARING